MTYAVDAVLGVGDKLSGPLFRVSMEHKHVHISVRGSYTEGGPGSTHLHPQMHCKPLNPRAVNMFILQISERQLRLSMSLLKLLLNNLYQPALKYHIPEYLSQWHYEVLVVRDHPFQRDNHRQTLSDAGSYISKQPIVPTYQLGTCTHHLPIYMHSFANGRRSSYVWMWVN